MSIITHTKHRRAPDPPPDAGVLEVSGNVHVLVERAGEVIHEETVDNMIVATGRDALRDMLLGVGGVINWIAVGKAATAVADTDVALAQEYFRGQPTRRISSTGKATYKLHLTTAEANISDVELEDGVRLQEIGTVIGASYAVDGTPLHGGKLFSRALVTPIAKDDQTQVTFTWEFPISST